MGYGPGAFGMGGFGHFIGALVGAAFGFFVFLVVVGLLFLLVRFLLAATKAAHIYIAKNSPATPPHPRTPGSGSAGAAYAPPATTVAPPAATVAPPAARPAPAAATPAATTPVVKPAKVVPPATVAKPAKVVPPATKPATKPRTPKPPIA